MRSDGIDEIVITVNRFLRNLKRYPVLLICFVVGVGGGFLARTWIEGRVDPVTFLQNWQTLTAGLLALIGAGMSVAVVQSQLRQADDHFQDDKRGKAQATRAVAAMALAEISHYAVEACKWAILLPEDRTDITDALKADIEEGLPPLPKDAIGMLTEATKYAESEDVKKIAELLERLQIQNSRMWSTRETVRGRELSERDNVTALSDSVPTQLLDAAVVHGYAGRLFAWARQREGITDARSDRETVSNALTVLGIDVAEYQEVWKLFNQYYPSDEEGTDGAAAL